MNGGAAVAAALAAHGVEGVCGSPGHHNLFCTGICPLTVCATSAPVMSRARAVVAGANVPTLPNAETALALRAR